MTPIRALPSIYAGVRFRSRLEANWARAFDERRIRWTYEPEGWVFGDGLCYLPDFWLPELRAFVEVKGILDERSEVKLGALCEVAAINDAIVVLAVAPAGERWARVRAGRVYDWCEGFDLCPQCQRWQFFGDGGCRACAPERTGPKPWRDCETLAERVSWCRWWAREMVEAGRLDDAEQFSAESVRLREEAHS